MTKNSGLGRGFDSLISSDFDESLLVNQDERIQKIDVKKIKPRTGQPRQSFDTEKIDELAISIKQHGVLQPIILSEEPGGDNYVIIAGERRWRAASQLGLKTIPAIVRKLAEVDKLQVSLIENVQRVNLSPLERAESMQTLYKNFGLSYDQIGEQIGKPYKAVADTIRLLKLPPEIKEALNNKQVTEGHAKPLLSLADLPDKRSVLLDNIINRHWSVRQAERFAADAHRNGKQSTTPAKQFESETKETEELSELLSTNVSIKHFTKGGKLEIKFESDQELDTLISMLLKWLKG